MERFDSSALFSIFKNEDGENLLPFDEMAALLDLGDLDVPPLPTTGIPIVTTEAPFGPEGPLGLDKPEVLPSTSGADDSDPTRAHGWTMTYADLPFRDGACHRGSNPSSDGGVDSDASDMEDGNMHDAGQPSTTTALGQPSTTTGAGHSGRSGKGAKASSGIKKRRQRNTEQMESNRVAQQKYRQRKKQEQSALQQAVDMLTAQVAALKAVEVRAGELEASNAALQATVTQQGSGIVALQQHSAAQLAELEATRAALESSQAQVAAQHRVILDQQAKLRLQEQVIASLKDRLKERIDDALLHVVPGTVCEKMVAAVKATLYDAKDVHGLQETLAQLPEHLVTELCKNIFHVCKESWPELRMRCSQQQVGGHCMTGAA